MHSEDSQDLPQPPEARGPEAADAGPSPDTDLRRLADATGTTQGGHPGDGQGGETGRVGEGDIEFAMADTE